MFMSLIREFDASDAGQVEACFVELQEFERQIEPRRVEGEKVARKYLEYMFEKCAQTEGKVFVLEADGGIVGFVSVWAKVKTNGLVNEEALMAYISDLIVLPAYRGRGLGRALLRRAEDYAVEQGARMLGIGVLAQNLGARKLYESFGFEENQVEMLKPLPNTDERAT